MDFSSPKIDRNSIRENTADKGAGIECGNSSSPVISNCLIFWNDAQARGGGIECQFQTAQTLINVALYGNTTGTRGGAFASKDHTGSVEIDIINSIVWGNTHPQVLIHDNTTLTVDHCGIEGGTGAVTNDGTGTLTWLKNITSDPLFENAAAGNLKPTWLSPCINRGTRNVPPGIDLDVAGNPRPTMGITDMGAYEFVGTHALAALQRFL